MFHHYTESALFLSKLYPSAYVLQTGIVVLCRLPLSESPLVVDGGNVPGNENWLIRVHVLYISPSDLLLFVTPPFLYHGVLLHSSRCHDGIHLCLPRIRVPGSSKKKGTPISAWSKTMADNRKLTQLSKANTLDRVQRYVHETRSGHRRYQIVYSRY